jgi:hypothetical protein
MKKEAPQYKSRPESFGSAFSFLFLNKLFYRKDFCLTSRFLELNYKTIV